MNASNLPPLADFHALLTRAREHHTQSVLANYLDVSERTIRSWETRESEPVPYLPVFRQLELLLAPNVDRDPATADFRFIDLFAGIGGIRQAFEGIGGCCVFTSE